MKKNDRNECQNFPEPGKLVRIYDYLPYTFWRMQRIFATGGYHLEQVGREYKANRKPGFQELYDLVDDNGGVLVSNLPLDAYRRFLASRNFPLYDEKSTCKQTHIQTNRSIAKGGSPKR